jgi:hypothetical protein
MKKTIVFCLFCVIFTLISVSVCFAQWEDLGFSFSDYGDEDTNTDADLYDDDPIADPGPAFGAENTAVPVPVSGSDDSATAAAAAAAAESAAASAAAAASSAETAAASAASAAGSAAAAADSASAASSSATAPPPSAPPQPPVRIVIPMMTAPSAPPPPPPPAPPAYQPPPVQPAPPVYSQPPITVIPAMPNPYSSSFYRVQVGAFSSPGLAQQCFSRLLSAGFSPAYEPYGNVNRIVLPGIRAADMALIVQRLAAAGFNEVWIREER